LPGLIGFRGGACQEKRYLRKYLLGCNYFQAIEGDYDPSHGLFMYSTLDNNARDLDAYRVDTLKMTISNDFSVEEAVELAEKNMVGPMFAVAQ